MPDTIIGLINNSFDKIILNSFLGLSSLGLYDIANDSLMFINKF